MHLRALRLPSFQAHWQELASTAEKQGWSYGQYLLHLAELEQQERKTRRIERDLKASQLPTTKTLGTLDLQLLPAKIRKVLPRLCDGGFVDRGDNLLVFGLPGRGKTHLVSAIGHELVRTGRRTLFVSTNLLVQRLLLAKRDLRLERELKRLDRFDALILDDLGYVQPIQCGAVNLMTAGSGIVHSERAGDDLNETSRLHGIQSWMALPESEQERDAAFQHYPAADLPDIEVNSNALPPSTTSRRLALAPGSFFIPRQ